MRKYALLIMLLFSIISSDWWVIGVEVEKARPLMILGGVAAAVIGNQDRGTVSGDILKYSGLACAISWTF